MSQPEIVQVDLDDEDVVAEVDLGGEDELYVTPTRTLLYRAEGLLSDESVEEYSHEAERITVSEGRRKAKVTLDYGLDGEETISLPAKRLERALHPIVEGVLKANGVLEADEPMESLFRFSELTVIIAGERVVRHIGGNLWDEDFETYHYSDVSDLAFEDGSVATSVVLTVNGRQERFKAPNDSARAVRSALETSLLSYWDVESIDELRTAAEPDEDDGDADETDGKDRKEVSFGDGPDPLIADPASPEEFPANATRSAEESRAEEAATQNGEPLAQQVERPPEGQSTASTSDAVSVSTSTQENGAAASAESEQDTAQDVDSGTADPLGSTAAPAAESVAQTDAQEPSPEAEEPTPGFAEAGFEPATPAHDEQILEELAVLRETVERQNEELKEQRELVEQLIEELRRGR